MPTLTTLNLIHILPMSQESRDHILSIYPDECSYETKNAIESIVGDLYLDYRDILVDERIQEVLGKGEVLPEGYHEEIVKVVESGLVTDSYVISDSLQLHELRRKISNSIQNI